jgi:hypothetical protein
MTMMPVASHSFLEALFWKIVLGQFNMAANIIAWKVEA